MQSGSRFAELEIGVHRQGQAYQAELRFDDAASEAELPPVRGLAPIDRQALLEHQLDPLAYGKALTQALFHDDAIHQFFDRAKTAAQAADLVPRLRVLVGPSAPELHGLRWELLRDPATASALATSERTLFSRFLVSHDWRPVKLRPKADLQALIAVAAPTDLARYKLADVDLEGEVARAKASLSGIGVSVAGQRQPLTLEHLIAELRAGVDILYLVCHGTLRRSTGESFLFLQAEDGTTGRVAGSALTGRIAELTATPRLAVLASCESAGTENGHDSPVAGQGLQHPSAQAHSALAHSALAHSALAPLLAEAGVSAVIAMQGKISMKTIEMAMPVFFTELLVDGQIDRAMAVARGAVREHPDHWMPALSLRLKGGRIWYEPGFGGETDEFKKWKSITSSIHRGTFVPIIGPELGSRSLGAPGQLAENLAIAHGFPMARHQRTDLAKVCQYLSIHQSRRFVQDEVLKELRSQIIQNHPELDSESDLKSLYKAAVRHRYQNDDDPFRILANLGGSVYVNANADPMLPSALAEAGQTPRALFCNWRKTKDNHPQEPIYEGTPSAKNRSSTTRSAFWPSATPWY